MQIQNSYISDLNQNWCNFSLWVSAANWMNALDMVTRKFQLTVNGRMSLGWIGKFSPSIKRWTKSEHQKAKRSVSCSQLLSINFSAAAAPQNKCRIKSPVCSKVTLKKANWFKLNMRVCELNRWMEKQMYWPRSEKGQIPSSRQSIVNLFSDMCVYALTYKDQACHLEKGFLWIWRQENTRVHGFTVRWYIWSGREGKGGG